MRTAAEILKKVRILEIKSKKLTTDLFTGEYHSAFKGKGMSFKEVREYAPGDDIRFIDWNVSARFGHPYSKVFEEERELSVVLLMDVSASSMFGTVNGTKRDILTEIAAIMAFSAINNGDKVGLIMYSDRIEKYIRPSKGKDHALYIVREMLTAKPVKTATRLSTALKYFNNTNRRSSIAFVLSDFIDENYLEALRVAAKKNDVVGIRVYDRMDQTLPDAGLILAEDPETGSSVWVDSSSKLVRHEYEAEFFKHTAYATEAFKRAGSDLLHVRTDHDYVKVLQHFFMSRLKR